MDIIATIAATILGFVSVIVGTVLLRVARTGPGKISYLRRKRYGVAAWATGSLPKTSDSTTVHELEGIEMKAERGRLVFVRQTRAPTPNID